jgi:serine/threonine protein kinase
LKLNQKGLNKGRKFDCKKNDAYALGFIAYRLLSDGYPFHIDSTEDDRINIQRIVDRSWHEEMLNRLFPDEIERDLVKGLLEENPAKRISIDDAMAHKFFEVV